MADRLQILIEALLKKTSAQDLEKELKQIEKKLKPIDISVDINAESQIKLHKSLQKIYKEEEKQRLNQEKIVLKEAVNKEKLLQYEQKVKIALEKEEEKQKNITLEIQKQLALYKEQLAIKNQNLKTTYGKSYDSSGMSSILSSANALNASDFKSVSDLKDTTKQLDLQVEKSTAGMRQLRKEATLAMKESDSFMTTIAKDFGKMIAWTITGTALFGTFRQLKEGISYVMELDNALNEIRIVTGQSQEQVQRLAHSYNNLAKQMGVTTKEVASTSVELYRQGLTSSEVEERMKAIIQYAKISSLSLSDANKIITATANATKEPVEKIIDIFALLGDKTASGADEIGEALQRVASAAENSGLSLEKSASWISTISSITRESASTIGRSLNSLISRYEQIKSTGFNEEDATKINDVTEALSQVGIIAVNSAGQLRPIDKVLDELGVKWDTLSKNEKAYIATTLGGTYQRNRLITLLDNYNDSLKNYETALNAAGTAQQKFNIYQQSTQAALDKTKASWEGFWQASFNSGIVKSIISGFSTILDLITKLGGAVPILAGVIGGVLTAAIIALNGGVIKLNLALIKTNILTGGLPILIGLVVTALTSLGVSIYNTNKEFSKQLDIAKELDNQYKNSKKSIDDNSASQQGNLELAKSLTSTLHELSKNENKSAEDKAYMATVVNKLNDLLPDLNLELNKETGQLNKQTDAIYNNIDALKELYITKAAENKAIAAGETIFDAEKQIGENKLLLEQKKATLELYRQAHLGSEYGGKSISEKLDDLMFNDPKMRKLKSEIEVLEQAINQNLQTISGAESDIDAYQKRAKEYAEKFGVKKVEPEDEEDLDLYKKKESTDPILDKQFQHLTKYKERIQDILSELNSLNKQVEDSNISLSLAEAQGDEQKQIDIQREIIDLLEQRKNKTHELAESVRANREEILDSFKSDFSDFTLGKDLLNLSEEDIANYKDSITSIITDIENQMQYLNKDDKAGKVALEQSKQYYENLINEFNNYIAAIDESKKAEAGLGKQWNDDNLKIAQGLKTINGILEHQQKELEKIEKEKLENVKEVESKIVEIIKKRYETERDLAVKAKEDQIEAEEKRHKQEMDDIEKESKAKEEAWQEELDRLEEKYNNDEYEKELAKEQLKLIAIKRQMDSLAMSDDVADKAKYNELFEDYQEQQEKIVSMRNKHNYENEKSAIQKTIDENKKKTDKFKENEDVRYNKTKDNLKKELDATKTFYENALEEGNLYFVARQEMASKSINELGNMITSFDKKYGNGFSVLYDSVDKLIAKLQQAKSLLSDTPSGIDTSTAKVGVTDYIRSKGLVASWNPNTKTLFIGKDGLLKPFDLTGFDFDSSAGKHYGTQSQIDVAIKKAGFRNGGINTETGLVPLHGTETKPELVLNSGHINNVREIFDIIKNPMRLFSKLPDIKPISNNTSAINLNVNLNGNVTREALPEFNKVLNNFANTTLVDVLTNNGLKPSIINISKI